MSDTYFWIQGIAAIGMMLVGIYGLVTAWQIEHKEDDDG